MWEPYAGLRYLQKPVDLVMLNTDEHVLTNPAVRIASQGGSVDWFRFWFQDYEDPDPAKAEQYTRWHELRKLQEANENSDRASTSSINPSFVIRPDFGKFARRVACSNLAESTSIVVLDTPSLHTQ